MLRRTLSILLLACALLIQGAWLDRSSGAMSAEGEARVLCLKTGVEGAHGAPAHHSSTDRCDVCLACGLHLLALVAVVAVLAGATLVPGQIGAFARQTGVARAFRRAWRPPVRAPPLFS